MVIILIIIAIIAVVYISNLPDDKVANRAASFESAFISHIGQDPESYIRSKISGGSDLGAIRYLFEIIEAEVEKKSRITSPGFDFYYAKAMRKQEQKPAPAHSSKVVQMENTSVKKNQYHRWTYEEDLLCCREFFKQYVAQRSSMDLQFFAQQLHRELPDISVRSLRMKTQNIQQLCIEHGISSSLEAKPLTQYSQQNRRAFMQAKKEWEGSHHEKG